MWTSATTDMIITGIGQTLYMTILSTVVGYVFGLPLGVMLAVSDKDGLRPNRAVYKVLDVISNIIRSIPFLILLILIRHLPWRSAHQHQGSSGRVWGHGCAPSITFIGPMVESSIKEVDAGVVEAARSMGASDLRIIVKVLLLESRTSLITGATIAIGTILGYSAMAGSVGGGGLGDIAIRYGYYRYESQIMIVTVILLVVLVQVFQSIGMIIASKLDKRRK